MTDHCTKIAEVPLFGYGNDNGWKYGGQCTIEFDPIGAVSFECRDGDKFLGSYTIEYSDLVKIVTKFRNIIECSSKGERIE